MVCKTLFIPRSYDMAVAAVVGAVGAAGIYVANKSANEQKRAQDRALQEQALLTSKLKSKQQQKQNVLTLNTTEQYKNNQK